MKTPQQRKTYPLYSGLLTYFPKALRYVSYVSYIGNQQHHPDETLHWDRAKSTDEPDALLRHLTDHAEGNPIDDDGVLHLGKVAWRALALLEKELEKELEKDEQTLTLEKVKGWFETNNILYGDNYPQGYPHDL